jgi:hypothetical protein
MHLPVQSPGVLRTRLPSAWNHTAAGPLAVAVTTSQHGACPTPVNGCSNNGDCTAGCICIGGNCGQGR